MAQESVVPRVSLWFDAENEHDMSGSLAGKTALVAGASRGIGRAIALKLAQAGADVAILYHNSHEEAEAVCGTIRSLGRRTLAIQADVGEPESVAEAFATLRQDFTRLDFVISNAAIGVLRPAQIGRAHV